MIGVLFIFLSVTWVLIAASLAVLATHPLRTLAWRVPIGLILFAALTPLPIIDELVGRAEFERSCQQHAEIVIDAPKTAGRTVWFGGSERTPIKLGVLDSILVRRNFVDAATQEPVYHYVQLNVLGGWIASFTESKGPLLFKGTCQPRDIDSWEKSSGIKQISRPITQAR